MRSFCKSIILLLVCGVFGAVTDEESVSVNEGESVTLHTNFTKLLNDDKIRWRFIEEGSATLIAEMTGGGGINFENDARFKDRLQILDLQTGDLIIKNIRRKHSGRYKVDHESDTGTTYKRFRVTVNDAPSDIGAEQSDVKSARVTEGDSVTLHTDVQTQRDDLILWRFGDKGVLLAKVDKEEDKSSIYDKVHDGMFRDRLKMDDQTGSLIITNTKTTDTGLYKLKVINNRDTKYKTFIVSVSERGLSAGQVTGIICGVLLLVFAVVGVIVYRRIKYEQQKQKVTVMTVPEGHSVTLESDVTKLQGDDVIQWSFKDKVIATFSKNKISSDEERLRDRLKVDDQTGYLTIRNVRTEDAGLYKVKISSSSRLKSFLPFITGGGPSYRQFNILVKDEERIRSVELGGFVTLKTDVTEIQTDDVIQWTFGDEETLIAKRTEGTEPSYESTDKRFRDRLKMNTKTGHLTISSIPSELSGVYRAKIRSSRGTEYRTYRVVVSDEERIKTVMSGDSVTLKTDVTEIQRDDKIQWRFGDEETLIAEMTVGTEPSSTDERFTDRLKLDPKTGHLIITNITSELSGVYKAKIIISSRGTEYRTYRVDIRGHRPYPTKWNSAPLLPI